MYKYFRNYRVFVVVATLQEFKTLGEFDNQRIIKYATFNR
jgi:hypothetical protein